METATIDIDKSFELSERNVRDPLEDLSQESMYYRLNETVFAEPIEIISKNSDDTCSEIKFVDNIMVLKRPGKRHKYYIDTNASKLICPQTDCTKTFATPTLLRAHIRKVHVAERSRFVCEQCGAGFSARYLLERHMAVHGAAKVECPECGVMLSRRTNLAQHLRTHSGARAHVCPQCGKKFVRRATLVTHARFVHATGAPQCVRCLERFPTRKLLTHHATSCRPK